MQFWIDQGVRIFRVDNPHTKPFAFWEWLIGEIKRDCPEAIFLAEAFTRPKVMYRLAKLGFTQSYNYFPWRNTKSGADRVSDRADPDRGRASSLAPNLWPNTPDILPEYLQYRRAGGVHGALRPGGYAGAKLRHLRAGLRAVREPPLAPGREEYLDSEKYEIKRWDITRPDSLQGLIGQVNQIRRDNPAFQANHDLRFHDVDNEQIIAYSARAARTATNEVLVVVNLDPHYKQSGFITLPLADLGLDPHQPYQAHDLLTDARYLWHGARNYVELNPTYVPAHIFVLRRRVRTEHDFDYYL